MRGIMKGEGFRGNLTAENFVAFSNILIIVHFSECRIFFSNTCSYCRDLSSHSHRSTMVISPADGEISLPISRDVLLELRFWFIHCASEQVEVMYLL